MDNFIVIQHDDGTNGLYGHFTHDGSPLAIGDTVTAGMPIRAGGPRIRAGGGRAAAA